MFGMGKKQPAATVAQSAMVARWGGEGFRNQKVTGLIRRNHDWLRYFTHSSSGSAKYRNNANQ
jgi:hypothetical protein